MKKRIVIALLTALAIAGVMSLVMAVINVGFSKVLIFAWLKGWLVGVVVSFPLSLLLPPRIVTFVNKYVS